jgi:hypothetical protein
LSTQAETLGHEARSRAATRSSPHSYASTVKRDKRLTELKHGVRGGTRQRERGVRKGNLLTGAQAVAIFAVVLLLLVARGRLLGCGEQQHGGEHPLHPGDEAGEPPGDSPRRLRWRRRVLLRREAAPLGPSVTGSTVLAVVLRRSPAASPEEGRHGRGPRDFWGERDCVRRRDVVTATATALSGSSLVIQWLTCGA